MNRIKNAFREDTGYRWLLLTILITGLSYGLYKGMLDNYLAEVVKMGEMGRGVTEFFRELPGILLVFILAVFYMMSAETMYKAGAIIMLVGMGMHALLPSGKVLTTLAICMYSLGEHIQLGMKSTLTISYAKEGRSGAALGVQSAAQQIGTLAGYLLIVVVFSFLAANPPFKPFFGVAAVLAAVSALLALRIKGSSMEPRFAEGDVVIVRRQPDAESGDIVIVTVGDEEATCKKLQKTPDGLMLISLNPAYAPMFYSRRECVSLPVRIYGRVVELRARF